MILERLIMALRNCKAEECIYETGLDLSALHTIDKNPGLVFCYSALMSVSKVLEMALRISHTNSDTLTCCVQVKRGLEMRAAAEEAAKKAEEAAKKAEEKAAEVKEKAKITAVVADTDTPDSLDIPEDEEVQAILEEPEPKEKKKKTGISGKKKEK